MNGSVELGELSREACRCRYCFDHLGLKAPTIAIAQPRWVGPHYWESGKKILVVLLNPGSGESRKDGADERMYQKLLAFRDSQDVTLNEIFSDQLADMRNWGRGRFWRYFIDGIDLKINEVAFANVSWCATSGNMYPLPMLSQCFDRFRSRLAQILSPDIVLLCGSNTHRFKDKFESMLSNVKVFPILHYAHREGRQVEEQEIQRIRKFLALEIG